MQAGHVAHPTTVDHVAVAENAVNVNPAEVGAVAGGPDDHGDVGDAAVGEANGTPLGFYQPGAELNSRPLELAPIGADDELPGREPPTQPGGDRDPEQAEPGEPPEQVPTGDPLRQHGCLGADRHVDGPGDSQLLGDLEPRVPAPYHQHAAVGEGLPVAIVGAVDLGDGCV